MSRTAEARTVRSRVAKAGALTLATLAAVSIGLLGFRSVTALSPADIPSPHRAAALKAEDAVSTTRAQ